MLVIRNLFGTGTNCIAPAGLPLLLCLFPGLAPWAFLSRPCGASFAPETSLVSGAKPRTPKGSSRTAQGASPGFKVRIAESPERAAQGVRSQLQITARHKEPLWYRDQLHRPFRASVVTVLVPRACALGFPESPLRG